MVHGGWRPGRSLMTTVAGGAGANVVAGLAGGFTAVVAGGA